MAQITEADRFLIDQIRRGDTKGWSQLVARYQGRLLAFARGQLSRKSESEDLVQETFVMFLQSLKNFKDECSLETYLFTILRRKIIDLYRGRQMRSCFINDLSSSTFESSMEENIRSEDPGASWYVRRDEQSDRAKAVLAKAIDVLVSRLKESENFRDLKIIEMLFFGQLRNQEASKIAGIDEKQIALIKHRMIKSLREQITADDDVVNSKDTMNPTDSLLTEVWEQWRFTCPKRSTIGRFLLGTMDKPWADYIDFHVNQLGCRFCSANVEDMKIATQAEQEKTYQKIFESTIGFFKPTGV